MHGRPFPQAKTGRWPAVPPCARAIAAALVLGLMSVHAGPAMAAPETACDRAAAEAARDLAVPEHILRAIGRVESGRRTAEGFVPWPWTVNVEGEGRWFDGRPSAEAFVAARMAAGARSIDVGCFQINHRWHGQAFATVEAMFDPWGNARYAAQFLRRLHAELGSWEAAIGAYHSRNEHFAGPYRARVTAMLARADAAPAMAKATQPDAPTRDPDRPAQARSAAPLIAAGLVRPGRASLVPLQQGRAIAPLFDVAARR